MILFNEIRRISLVLLIVITSLCVQAQTHFKREKDRYGLFNQDSALTEFLFTEVSNFQEGLCWVNKGELYGYITEVGDSITAFCYADVSDFYNGYAAVSRDTIHSKYGFIDHNGSEICQLQYSRVRFFEYGLAAVQKDSLWGMIDTLGREVIPCHYDHPPLAIRSTFIIASKGGKWGVVNSFNQLVYPFKFDLITRDGIGYIANSKFYLGLL